MAVIVVLVVAVVVGMKSLTAVPGRLYSFSSMAGQGSLPPAKATRGVLQP
jgi:hypothetical protein